MIKIKNSNMELDLEDPATIEAIRSAEVVNTVDGGAPEVKKHHFSISFSDQQIAKLCRLNPNGDWKLALEEHIDSLLHEKIGRSIISGPSQYGQKISGPSNSARFV